MSSYVEVAAVGIRIASRPPPHPFPPQFRQKGLPGCFPCAPIPAQQDDDADDGMHSSQIGPKRRGWKKGRDFYPPLQIKVSHGPRLNDTHRIPHSSELASVLRPCIHHPFEGILHAQHLVWRDQRPSILSCHQLFIEQIEFPLCRCHGRLQSLHR